MTVPRSSRPEVAVLVVGVVSALVTFGALGFAWSQVDHERRDNAALEEEVVVPLTELRAAMADFDASQADFARGVAAASPDEAGALFSHALTETGDATQHWENVEAAPLGVEGEAEAHQAVDDAIAADAAAGEALGIAVLDPVREPGEVAALQDRSRATTETLRSSLQAVEDEILLPALAAGVRSSRRDAERTSLALVVAALVLGVVGATVTTVGYRRAAKAGRAADRERARQDLIAHENALEAELQHALDMADDEASVHDVLARALATADDPCPADFLLADSSGAHFRHVVAPDEARGMRCPVRSPMHCPVTRHGQQAVFRSSGALDACAHLREHPAAPCAAVCVPVSIGGRAIGVIHECHPDGEPPPEHRIHEIEIVARKAGEHLGMIRAFATSQTQAHTDPLTGLLNRRSLADEVAALGHESLPFAVAFADLDHFKDLNDTFGHDVGDKALRLFATVLRSGVRPGDIVSRYGGEEFVVVLPGCGASAAEAVMGRVQDTLATALLADAAPHFTVSVGIAVATSPAEFEEVLALADGSLLRAKALGRDRIVVAGDLGGPDHPRPADGAGPGEGPPDGGDAA